jgi:hypothetical protein
MSTKENITGSWSSMSEAPSELISLRTKAYGGHFFFLVYPYDSKIVEVDRYVEHMQEYIKMNQPIRLATLDVVQHLIPHDL